MQLKHNLKVLPNTPIYPKLFTIEQQIVFVFRKEMDLEKEQIFLLDDILDNTGVRDIYEIKQISE